MSYAPIAQLDRVPGFEPGGRRFESVRARHNFNELRRPKKLPSPIFTTFSYIFETSKVVIDGWGTIVGSVCNSDRFAYRSMTLGATLPKAHTGVVQA